MSENRQRPFGVSLLSLILIVAGVLQIGGGIFAFVQRNDEELLASVDATSSDLSTLGIVTIALGVVALLVGLAMRRGESWARTLVGVLALINVGFLVFAAISYHHIHWYNVAWPALFYALIAGYLFSDEDAKRFFA